jgi:MoxR-like ATPase
MIDVARRVHVAPSVQGYVISLVEATRAHEELMLGASPRSSLALQRLSRVRAAADGREFVTPDDIKALAPHTLAHRMALRPEAQMRGTAMEDVIASVLRNLTVPGSSRMAT